jgi:signal transduction histidine kinase
MAGTIEQQDRDTSASEPGTTRVLLVEDNPAEARLIREMIADAATGEFSIEHVERLGEALSRLQQQGAEAVLLDLTLPDSRGLETVERVREQSPRVPIVVLTGLEDDSIGVEAVKCGAQDYLAKSHAGGDLLTRTLRYAIERQRVRIELQEARMAQLRQQERLNRELAIRNEDLEDFTHVASHDLREPLRKMISFSDLLRRDLGDPISEKVARDIGFIRDAAERMQHLVDDLLALSRASRSSKQRRQLALDDCVDAALEALYMRLEETGATIERDALPEVWGDSTMLTQLYQNLISNAIKFCDRRPPQIRITAEKADQRWVFGVADNGIGINPAYAKQIFRPFQRLHSPREYEGSGIGLSICQKAVERHGGEIWVEPTPEGGSHFKFYLRHRSAPRVQTDSDSPV